MKILIVDENSGKRSEICNLLHNKTEKFKVFDAEDFNSAIDIAETKEPDLFFLNMDTDFSATSQFIYQIRNKPKKSIFILYSKESKNAVHAFDYGAQDFLIESFNKQRFYKSIDKVMLIKEYLKLGDQVMGNLQFNSQVPILLRSLPVKLGNKTMFIKVNNIKYIIADRYYAEIYTKDKKHVIRESLTKLFHLLQEDYFFRIHRSYIININFLQEIIHSEKSELDVRMEDGKLFHVSRSHRKSFTEKLAI
ncbi:response regulator transcription factor [Zunongwangia sp. SCSIO 43204]|uniref:LytR/AlgR family response regulator transcription factor n=1 Tax=Zunongwangia sp. SCSIO 43204 TaxID=2779359 RepID=UPI001CA974A3|nr:LytTR family DNA-binding domain-containing protein [Zunongwangia sp. SCSIO 43204]UAB84148.1 response regulator transcription factor [Zunongwangia sp. SCSIO 43204]